MVESSLIIPTYLLTYLPHPSAHSYRFIQDDKFAWRFYNGGPLLGLHHLLFLDLSDPTSGDVITSCRRPPAGGEGKQTSLPSCRRFVMRRRRSRSTRIIFCCDCQSLSGLFSGATLLLTCWGQVASALRLLGCSKMTSRLGLVFASLLCTSMFFLNFSFCW